MRLPIYLYCTMAKPYLVDQWNYAPDIKPRYSLDKEDPEDDREGIDYQLGVKSFNGSVCFRCECKEAFKLRYLENAFAIDIDKSFFYSPSNEKHSLQYHDMLKRSQMTEEQLLKYGKGKDLFALHLEKVDRTYPMGIAEFYKDEACTKPLTKAPQSYCHAYRWVLLNDDDVIDNSDECDGQLVGSITDALGNKAFYDERFGYYRVEQCLIYSIRPEWLCKIANGEKDLEVRKTCPKEIEVK